MPIDTILKDWIEGQFPCSFQYDGQESDTILAHWEKKVETRAAIVEGNQVTDHVIVYSDPLTHLTCTITARSFRDFPAVDWVIEFQNNGMADTPILEEIHALEWIWRSKRSDPPVLQFAKGSDCQVDDFLPQSQPLIHWKTTTLGGVGGRSSVSVLPFFYIQQPAGGVFVGIGWSGQWVANLNLHQPTKRDDAEVAIDAGMEHAHLSLYPGEKIRTPRILLFFHEGDRLTGQNRWRQLMLNYYTPHVTAPGNPSIRRRATVPLAYPMWGGIAVQEHLDRIKMLVDQRLGYDYYWIDAAWFMDESETQYDEASGTWAKYVGRWRPNAMLYPRGLKPIGDAAHAAGLKFLLWMEPERARGGMEWPQQHPEFYLRQHDGTGKNEWAARTASKDHSGFQHRPRPRPQPQSQPHFLPQEDLLFNLGLPEARQFLFEFICDLIQEAGIDCFRQDFNISPLPYWRNHDAPDRQGMTEILHVQGLYQLWDDLRRRFPGLLIDNCASGGRRIDIETMQRSIPLWRSDTQCFPAADPMAAQIATAGLAAWVPLSSTGTQYHTGDDYAIRSAYSSGLVFHHGNPPPSMMGMVFSTAFDPVTYPWAWHRKRIDEFKRAQPFFEEDFYLLGNCTASTQEWLVYQCDRPDLDQGFVLAFRRQDSPYVQAQLKLHGLDPKKRYSFENVDTGHVQAFSGAELLSKGLLLTMGDPRSSCLQFYRKLP